MISPQTEFPWTTNTLETFKTALKKNASFSVTWYWAPFHEPSFKALKYAAQKKIKPKELDQILENLSVPTVPQGFDNSLMDPEVRIRKTLSLCKENPESFSTEDICLPTIDDLILDDPNLPQIWKVESREDSPVVTRWLAKEKTLLERFQNLNSWEKLKVIECIIGVTKVSSVLNFERIY